MLTKLKEKVQAMLAAEAKAAHEIGLTPNQISLMGIALAFLSALTYVEWHINKLCLLFATVLLLFSGFCDILDGALARLYHKATPFGGFLDSLLDRYADAFVYIGIIVGGLCDTLWGLIALTGSLLVSYSRARAEAAEIKMESIGLAERAERMIILAIASITAFFWKLETDLFWQPINIGVIVLAILSNLTVLQRSVYAYKKLKKQGN